VVIHPLTVRAHRGRIGQTAWSVRTTSHLGCGLSWPPEYFPGLAFIAAAPTIGAA
jgi:hypothetical protein